MKTKLLLVICLLAQVYVFAQSEIAWVYFKDKAGVAEALENPITILTQRALDRKARHGVKIDERDVPVNEAYIAKVKQQSGITVKAKSKWMNCVTVIGEQRKISALKSLDCVKEIEYASKSLNVKQYVNLKRDKFEVEVPTANQNVLTDFEYGKAANQVKMLNVHKLHKKGFTGEGMLIAVIDDGFKNVNKNKGFKRIRDAGKILGTYDFARRTEQVYSVGGHGTAVLSCIAGYSEGQYAGTCPDASFYLFRSEDDSGETPVEEALWVEATERADSLGVDVTNTSLGYTEYDNKSHSHKTSDMTGSRTFAARGGNISEEKGLLSVVAAGNENGPGKKWKIVATPGDSKGVLTIGAVGPSKKITSFSSLGSSAQATQKPDVMAQGGSAMVFEPTGTSPSATQGTSFSSPIMCGAVTTLWQALPHLDSKKIKQIVRESASQFNNPDYKYGYGIPDFDKALTLSDADFQEPVNAVKLFPNPASSKITIALSETATTAKAEIYNVLGKRVKAFTVTPTTNTFNIADLANGVYLVNVSVEGASKTLKLVKK